MHSQAVLIAGAHWLRYVWDIQESTANTKKQERCVTVLHDKKANTKPTMPTMQMAMERHGFTFARLGHMHLSKGPRCERQVSAVIGESWQLACMLMIYCNILRIECALIWQGQ